MNILENQKGFTLMETLVSLFIILLIMVGVFNLIILSLRLTADNSYYTEAIEIANQKMEYIRNLPYDDVGTLTGSPAGILNEFESIQREGNYTVHTQVIFYDDPYDGTLASSTDTVFVDYKIATIEVSWNGKYGRRDVTVFSKIIPNTEETLAGYGLLKLFIVDADGSPVPNADVYVYNTSPIIDANYVTNLNGEFTLPLLPDFEGYEVTVSKAGYGVDRTHARDLININPSKPHLSIFDTAKTEESFSIDKLANLTIRTVTNNLPDNWPVSVSSYGENINVSSGIDNNNYIYATWEEEMSTSTLVQLNKYNVAGVSQWANPIIISTSTFPKNPNITVTKSGVQFIVWNDNSTTLKQLAKSENINHYANKKNKAKLSINFELPLFAPQNIFPKNYFILDYAYFPFFNKPKNVINKNYSLDNILNQFKTKYAKAQASANIIQTKISGNVSSASSISTSFNTSPTEGNLLVAISIHRNSNDSFSAPYNSSGTFSEAVYSDISWSLDIGMWYKIAEASEPSQVTINSSASINGGVLMLLEISGIDSANPLDVIAENNQTSGDSFTGTSGQTGVSTDSGFAISAIAFADNNFSTPNSSNWSSESSDNWSHELWNDWSIGNDGSLGVATMNITNADNQSATLNLTGPDNEERNGLIAIFNLAPSTSITVSAIESQISTTTIPALNQYVGGKIVILENDSNRDVDEISIHEKGTVNASTSLENFKLYYDLDTSPPYDCVDEQYNEGTDLQFGNASIFLSDNGSTTINHFGGVQINTTQTLCLYPVTDVNINASSGETLDFYINNPKEDIIISAGIVSQTSQIDINGSTELLSPANIEQLIYRWRNDDGTEENATWNQPQNNPASTPIVEPIRLRLELTNTGGQISNPFEYSLEYGEYTGSCNTISTWNTVPTDNSLHWKIVNSSNVSDNATTSNIVGGLTDENFNFVEGYIKDNSNLTPGISLDSNEFTEIEFSIEATSNAEDKSYCFRLTNDGSTFSIDYIEYPIATITGDNNIFISAYDAFGVKQWGIKKVNSDMTNFEQTNPVISHTENFGRPTTTIVWIDERNGNKDIYAQSFDNSGNKLWGSDLQIKSTGSDEEDATLVFDSNDDFYVLWTSSEGLSKDLYIEKYNLEGTSLSGAPISLISSTVDEFSPNISIDSSDNLYIGWTENFSGVYNVLLAKFDTSLTKLWEINPNTSSISFNQNKIKTSVAGSTIYAVWSDEREGNLDIYSQKIENTGTILWTDDMRININTGSTIQKNPNILTTQLGNPIGLWQDQRNGNFEIFATAYSDPGSLTSVNNVPLIITGTKKIGDSPIILEYEKYTTSGATGEITLQVEWDVPGYSIDVNSASTSYSVIFMDPIQPMAIMPEENKSMILYVE